MLWKTAIICRQVAHFGSKKLLQIFLHVDVVCSHTLTIRDGFEDEQSSLLKGGKMLKTYRIIPLAFIYFLVFGFSFIALQVTTEEVEAAGVCEPVDRIKQRKNADSQLWFQR